MRFSRSTRRLLRRGYGRCKPKSCSRLGEGSVFCTAFFRSQNDDIDFENTYCWDLKPYNHADSELAEKLNAALKKNGIEVRIDRAVMEAGATIQEFIESSIRETDVTISIVSNRSLLSAWVALESIETFYKEKSDGGKKFIACYIDDDFFGTDFRLKATKQIDAKIADIDNKIPAYIALKIDTNDLNNQKSRLYKLRNNLGDILVRLRESLCLDLRGDKFDESVLKIVSAIKGES